MVNDYLAIRDKLLMQLKNLPSEKSDDTDILNWKLSEQIRRTTNQLSLLLDLLDRCINLCCAMEEDETNQKSIKRNEGEFK